MPLAKPLRLARVPPRNFEQNHLRVPSLQCGVRRVRGRRQARNSCVDSLDAATEPDPTVALKISSPLYISPRQTTTTSGRTNESWELLVDAAVRWSMNM